MRCEYVVVALELVEPPPTFIPLARVPATPPMPKAPVIEPRFTPNPLCEPCSVVVEVGT